MAHNEEKEKLLERAMDDLCTSLNQFGPEEITKLLIYFSDKDSIVNRLLARLPGIISVGDFLFRLPCCKVDEQTFKKILETQGPIWIKGAEKKQQENNLDTHPEITKRRQISKRKKRKTSVTDTNHQGLDADRQIIA